MARATLTRNTVFYGAGSVLSKFLSFLMLPVMTRYLLPADYGAWQILLFYARLVMIISLLGLNSAIFRFYMLSADSNKRGALYFTTIVSVAASSIVILGIASSAPRFLSKILLGVPEGAGLVVLATIAGIFDGWFILTSLWFRMEEKPVPFGIYSILQTGTMFTLAVIFVVYFRLDVEGILIASIIANIAVLVPIFSRLARYLVPVFDIHAFRGLLFYGLPFVPTLLMTMIFTLSDRWLIRIILGLKDAGIYAAGYKLASLVLLALTAFRFAWSPRMFIMHSEGKLLGALPRIYITLTATLVIVAGGLSIFCREIFAVVIGSRYEGGMWIAAIVGSVYILDGIALLAQSGIYIHGKTTLLPFITAMGAILNIALNLYLIPRWGIMGAAAATLISYLALTVLYIRAGQAIMPVKLPVARLGILGVTMLLFYGGAYFVEPLYQRIIIFVVLSAITVRIGRLYRLKENLV